MTQGLDPMQVLRLRQALGEQVNQVRGVPELFGQRDGMFPNGYNPMHVGTNGDGTLDVFARSEKWIGNPPTPETAKWSNRELEILGWSTYIGDLGSVVYASIPGVRFRDRAGVQMASSFAMARIESCTASPKQETDGNFESCFQWTPSDCDVN